MITGIGNVWLLEPDGDEAEVHEAASALPGGCVVEWDDGTVSMSSATVGWYLTWPTNEGETFISPGRDTDLTLERNLEPGDPRDVPTGGLEALREAVRLLKAGELPGGLVRIVHRGQQPVVDGAWRPDGRRWTDPPRGSFAAGED